MYPFFSCFAIVYLLFLFPYIISHSVIECKPSPQVFHTFMKFFHFRKSPKKAAATQAGEKSHRFLSHCTFHVKHLLATLIDVSRETFYRPTIVSIRVQHHRNRYRRCRLLALYNTAFRVRHLSAQFRRIVCHFFIAQTKMFHVKHHAEHVQQIVSRETFIKAVFSE